MPTVTAAFNCEYEFSSYTTGIEIIERGDGDMLSREVATFVRRGLAESLSSLTHIAGNIVLGSALNADIGDGTMLVVSPADANFICTSDTWEHDEYGTAGNALETWQSFKKFEPYTIPTEASGSVTLPTATCLFPPMGIQSSISDTDFIAQITDGVETLKQRIRHSFTITREIGGLRTWTSSVGTVSLGASIHASFGKVDLTYLTPNPTELYLLETESLSKAQGSKKIIQSQTWTSYKPYTLVDIEALNYSPPSLS